jgi:superfamily II DNA or RNA helicase
MTEWKRTFNMLRMATEARRQGDDRVWYRLMESTSRETDLLVVEVYRQRRKADGAWGRIAAHPLGVASVRGLSRAEDREPVALLEATAPSLREHMHIRRRYATLPPASHRSFVPAMSLAGALPKLCATGRFFTSPERPGRGVRRTRLRWDAGPPWTFAVAVERDPKDEDRVRLTGRLRRGGGEVRAVTDPDLLIDGCVLFGDTLAAFDDGGLYPWIWQLREDGDVHVSVAQLDEMLDELWNLPVLPPVEMPEEWPLHEVRLAPRPRLVVRSPPPWADGLTAEARFDYDGLTVAAQDPRAYLVDRPGQRVVVRDREAEAAASERLVELGANETPDGRFAIAFASFPDLVLELLAEGWIAEAEGRRLRRPAAARLTVASGIDWLRVCGDVRFDRATEREQGPILAPLPELLLAVRRRERLIRLGDGSHGVLPQEWLERYGPLARLGEEDAGAWRFQTSHAILLDALLGADLEVEADPDFERLRERLRSLDRLEPHREPAGFTGELRPYQRQGLAWMRTLRHLGLGGCLADDMGLGKTVQVLALLASRSADRREPSLVVVPRSLVGNWIDEAARFTPGLDVLAYHGAGRGVWLDRLAEHDVVVTTYGTLRRDVEDLAAVAFDVVVLDEAQAIKNVFSKTARACRRLQARQRLALSGTPVENHLGELGSIFGFLNPGMLGKVPGFEELLGERRPGREALGLLGRVLRPFLLRRTKEAVLPELPAKTEQILYCDLRPRQQRQYDELLVHYRAALRKKIDAAGLERSKIEIIEALLRLRQAACHPGLVDPARGHQRGTKLDVLLRHLREVLDEGHKALVFSQFTKFLALLRQRLDRLGTPYEYLDGSTRDRRRPVERFQGDPGCPLFLISLKAGGFGLNLTAADYVFLLDPWWNPAVEAQAVDRAHRIGQTRPVFAYRLIARGTVEEKILELQEGKRELAEAILTADQSLIKNLSADDLRFLLS